MRSVEGLLPEDIDLTAATVTVCENRVELPESPIAFDASPKTDVGKRTVSIPPHVLPILAARMRDWSGTDRVFVGRDRSDWCHMGSRSGSTGPTELLACRVTRLVVSRV